MRTCPIAVLTRLGVQNLKSAPHRYFSDGDTVIALNDIQVGGETGSSVEDLQFNSDAKIARFESFGTRVCSSASVADRRRPDRPGGPSQPLDVVDQRVVVRVGLHQSIEQVDVSADGAQRPRE